MQARHVGAAVLVLAGLVASAPARAGDRVIPPDAGTVLFPVLANGAPGYAVASARIERDAVWASLCRRAPGGAADPTRCFTLRLTDPRAGCASPSGPWCVGFPDGAPPDDARAPLVSALAALPERAIWIDADTAAPPKVRRPAPQELAPPAYAHHPFATALATLLVPLAAGAAVGRALRRLRRASVLAWLPPLGVVAALPALPRVGAWDLLATAALLGAGVAAGTSRLALRPLLGRSALAFAAVLVALAGFEVVCRALPSPAASFPPPERARIAFDEAPGAALCAPLHPAEDPSAFAARTAELRAGVPIVLHVGDSMVEGVGVRPDEAFPALLGRMQPGVEHVNAGFASTSIDFQLLLARAWLDRVKASHVVLYVFGYNDFSELDRELPCCPGGPLLDDAAHARCPDAAVPISRRALFATSPAPYAIRVATARSALARRMAAGFAALGVALRRRGPAGNEARFERYAEILRALRDDLASRGVRLTVVYLPARASLEQPMPETSGDHALKERVLALCASLGIETIDPWAMLADAVRRDGAGKWFLPPPDVHFTPEGHRLLAEWLAPRLAGFGAIDAHGPK